VPVDFQYCVAVLTAEDSSLEDQIERYPFIEAYRPLDENLDGLSWLEGATILKKQALTADIYRFEKRRTCTRRGIQLPIGDGETQRKSHTPAAICIILNTTSFCQGNLLSKLP
jgi:hypothetical protein